MDGVEWGDIVHPDDGADDLIPDPLSCSPLPEAPLGPHLDQDIIEALVGGHLSAFDDVEATLDHAEAREDCDDRVTAAHAAREEALA